MSVLKVKSTSDPNKVAGALAGTIREIGKERTWRSERKTSNRQSGSRERTPTAKRTRPT